MTQGDEGQRRVGVDRKAMQCMEPTQVAGRVGRPPVEAAHPTLEAAVVSVDVGGAVFHADVAGGRSQRHGAIGAQHGFCRQLGCQDQVGRRLAPATIDRRSLPSDLASPARRHTRRTVGVLARPPPAPSEPLLAASPPALALADRPTGLIGFHGTLELGGLDVLRQLQRKSATNGTRCCAPGQLLGCHRDAQAVMSTRPCSYQRSRWRNCASGVPVNALNVQLQSPAPVALKAAGATVETHGMWALAVWARARALPPVLHDRPTASAAWRRPQPLRHNPPLRPAQFLDRPDHRSSRSRLPIPHCHSLPGTSPPKQSGGEVTHGVSLSLLNANSAVS